MIFETIYEVEESVPTASPGGVDVNLQKLRRSTDESDYPFYKDVVKRLERLFPFPHSEAEWKVIGCILFMYEIRFSDGFVLNPFCSDNVLGISEAAKIVAALCDDPDRDWEWWRSHLSGSPTPPRSDFENMLNNFLGRILNNLDVCAIYSSSCEAKAKPE